MSNKSTDELHNILGSTDRGGISGYLQENADDLLAETHPFSGYMRQMLRKYNTTQQQVFLLADIPERFGYKLLSGEKHTRQRDYILRLCYATGMNLEEVQRALTLYGMAPLYPRFPRDAVLMIAFNQQTGSIHDVDALLSAHGLPTLKSSGVLE